MTDIGNRFKQTLQDQSTNLKFIELLNSNRNIESIKDREILPAIPLSAFNPTGLPSIYKEKAVIGVKMRSVSQKRIKGVVEGKNQGSGRKDTEYLGLKPKGITTGSMKNLIKIRNKSQQSAHRDRNSFQNNNTKRSNPNKRQQPRQQDHPQTNPLLTGPFSHKSIMQLQITPQKLKIDLPQTTYPTKQTTLNKTIQQLSNEATDSLMLNIKFGKIQQNISYKAFMKKQIVPTAGQVIKRLQDWLNRYKIKSGIIYTRNLHNIFGRKMIANNMVLSQFANYTQMRRELQHIMPGLQYYTEPNKQIGRNLAATKIQSLFKMNFDIKYTKKLKSLMNKVKIIQKQWRVCIMARRCRQKVMARINMKIELAKSLTNGMIKNWEFIRTSPRVEVHISSIALQQFKRLSIPDLQQRQIAQITRIFKAIEPDCTVVFVTPLGFTGQITRYYQRVFQFGNKADCFRDRLYFVSVQKIIQRISNHMTTVSALLYDHESLLKIRQIVKNRQNPVMGQVCAYIVPSYPSNQYANLSSQLEIPVFSGSQSLSKLYSTKSGHYELLSPLIQSLAEKTPFIFPKTIHSIYSQKQLMTTLSILIHKHKQVKKWMFKIDDEVNGRGLAYLNVDGLGFLKQLRRRSNDSEEQDISDKDLIGLIMDQLKAKLRMRLKILNKKVYPDYNAYISHFLTRGGFLQACIQPFNHSQKVYKPIQHSIGFKIQPNGQFQISATYSRLQLGHKSLNSSIESPSLVSSEYVDSEKIVRALYRHLWTKHKIFGYFSIDLLVFQQKGEVLGNSNVYVIGFDCFLNQKVAGLLVPVLVSNAEFRKSQNKFYTKSIQSELKVKSQLNTQKSLTEQSQKMSATTLQLQNKKNPTQQKQLYFLYCPFIKRHNLPSIPQFFKLCKFANISFDVQLKIGTLVLLQGGFESGCFGFLCIANSRQAVTEEALKLVQFLSKSFSEVGGKLKDAKEFSKSKPGWDQIGQLRGYLINCAKKDNNLKSNMRKQDLSLQMIF